MLTTILRINLCAAPPNRSGNIFALPGVNNTAGRSCRTPERTAGAPHWPCRVRGYQSITAAGRLARAVAATALTILAWAAPTVAQPVVITGTTTLNPGSTSITATAAGSPAVPLATAEITVQGGTLVVNGRHSIASLQITDGGLVTHDLGFTYDSDPGPAVETRYGLWLEVSGDVTIDAPPSRIDVTAKGYGPRQSLAGSNGAGSWTGSPNCGSSGAGHGGSGGSTNCQLGGSTYGSITEPTTMGAGGGTFGSTSNSPNPAISGGGVVRLVIGGTLNLNGSIVANGGTVSSLGAGAGGSIWIDANALTGIGAITANGGDAGSLASSWGSGGGGRIAMYAASTTLPTGGIQAGAGLLGSRGGAGSFYQVIGVATPTVTYDNLGAGGQTMLSGTQVFSGDLIITGGAILSHPQGVDTLRLEVSNNLIISAGAAVDVTAKGYGPRQALAGSNGAGQWSGNLNCGSSGAGHGGSGGATNCNLGGSTYGSSTEPVTMGAGGGTFGSTSASPNMAVTGGGVVRFIVGGTLTVDGSIVANGGTAGSVGAGAGGSLWIDATAVTGEGVITANGGDAAALAASWGSGGGGRVAIYAASITLPTNSIQARAGMLGSRGGAGSVYQVIGSATPTLTYDNLGAGGQTMLSGTQTVTGDLIVSGGAVLSHAQGDSTLRIDVSNNLVIAAGAAIDVTAKGYAPRQAPAGSNGAGLWSGGFNCGSSGAGHGGLGGSSNCFPGGSVYGSITEPTTMGAGGGTFGSTSASPNLAVSGGGVVRLIVGGTLTVDGSIMANGGTASVVGAGAGGSLWIDASTVAGSGVITANGGDAGSAANSWGSGGGGRIAIYSCVLALPASHINSHGGSIGNPGESNDVYLAAALISAQPLSTVSCEQTEALFDVTVVGPGPYTYQWRKDAVPLSDGLTATGSGVSGSASPRLTLRGITEADDAGYDCLVLTACGGIASTVATLQIALPCSLADVVGAAGGNQVCGDSTVDGSDFVTFINSFATGDPAIDPLADVAGGGSDGLEPDGIIDGSDFITFINAFSAGC